MSSKLVRVICVTGAAAVGLCLFVSIRETFAKYDEPVYEVLKRDGEFEIRAYQGAVAVEADMSGPDKTGANDAFRKLFKYISGYNSSESKIPMTAPVLKAAGEKIAMTVPVLEVRRGPQSGSADENKVMQFFMPAGFSLQSTPKPRDPALKVLQLPARKLAVLRFSGFAKQKTLESKEAQLRQILRERHLEATGDALYAFYNAPFTLPFLRRNEVMIEVREQG